MSIFMLYLLLVKATLTSFTGGTSLPSIRQDFVADHAIINDKQLSTAVAIGRMGPGPNGSYLICVGYYAAGLPGALAGYLAMITPAFLAIVFLRLLQGRTDHPRWQGAIRGLTAAAAGLMLSSGWPIAQQSITGWFPFVNAAIALALFFQGKIDTIWILLGSSLLAVLASMTGFAML